ncbi:hypothetical protein O6P43_009173 [Quillaja saponaria]|uniref:Uncharacterized protein n=1 Tax=Quillaja saponaria TaxID=32244 RepID=A0AAD7VCJ3_QUISA|nr:hypothetical protein O6P43_009173 [Quillaja saponaria]
MVMVMVIIHKTDHCMAAAAISVKSTGKTNMNITFMTTNSSSTTTTSESAGSICMGSVNECLNIVGEDEDIDDADTEFLMDSYSGRMCGRSLAVNPGLVAQTLNRYKSVYQCPSCYKCRTCARPGNFKVTVEKCVPYNRECTRPVP